MKFSFFFRLMVVLTLYCQITCCTTESDKTNTATSSKIFPLSPFTHEGEVIVESKGEFQMKEKSCVRIFILENDIPDTGYLKKQLFNFIDSSKEEQDFLKNHFQCQYWFYKTSSKLNKNYVEDPKRNSLGHYEDDLIADLRYKNGLLYWVIFYSKTQIIQQSYQKGIYFKTYTNRRD